MKIEKSTPVRKTLLMIACIVVLLSCSAYVGYRYLSSRNNPSGTKTGEPSLTAPTKDEINAGNDAKKQTIDSNNSSSSAKTSETSSDTQNQKINIGISAINQTPTALQIRTVINTLSNTGQCSLTMTKDSSRLTRTATTYASANVSSCRGFDIPLSDLSSGDWDTLITVTLSGQTSSVSQKIQVK